MFPLVLYLGEHQLCDKTELGKVIHRQCFRLLILSHKSHWECWNKSQHGLDKPSHATCICHKKKELCSHPSTRKANMTPTGTSAACAHVLWQQNKRQQVPVLQVRSHQPTAPETNQLENVALVRGTPSSNKLSS